MKYIGYKSLIILLIALLTSSTVTFAQNRRIERIQSLKTQYITNELQLTPLQSKKFWPVYRRYEEDLKGLRRSYMKQYSKQDNRQSQEEARRYIDDNLDYQDALVDLKRKYKNEFLRIITPKQLTRLYAAEREFRQMLIQRLRERKRKV